MWTKEETDQLFELCERFDLRFTIIADRFPLSRTVEELKDRYYSGMFGPHLFSDHYPFTYTLSFHLFSSLFSLFLKCVAPGFVRKYKE